MKASTIPSSLSDDALYAPLEGSYSVPQSNNIDQCKIESTKRAIDVINLVTSIRNNNAEMEAIRKINK